jgi:hypothetical protein
MTAAARAEPVGRLALMLAAALAVAAGWPRMGVTLWIVNRVIEVSDEGHPPRSRGQATRHRHALTTAAGLVMMSAAFAHTSQAPALMWTAITLGHAVAAWSWLSAPVAAHARDRSLRPVPLNAACEREATIAYLCWAGVPASIEPLGWVLIVMLGVSIVRHRWSASATRNQMESAR